MRLLEVLDGKTLTTPPMWLMRQAGRYLPEYRQTRAQAGSFLDLCYNPELACEVTLQPIRRFGFDAAILFSDILVVPDAMGRSVRFVEGEGPRLDPIEVGEIATLSADGATERLKPVLEAVAMIRDRLPAETALLGFCGAPWTVATYMVAGKGSPDQAVTRLFGFQHREAFEALLDVLSRASAAYLVAQLRAGANAVQIFDSWSGVLGEEEFARWCMKPVRQIVDLVRAEIPDARIIGFPRGAAGKYEGYRAATGVTALGLDWTMSTSAAMQLQKECAIQGNLDPVRLVAGGRALEEGVESILSTLGNGPLIFNLGHGITPDAPIANVERLVQLVRRGIGQ